MKKFYLLILSSLLFCISFASQKKELVKKDASWADAKAWSPEGVPADNDIVYIPSGYTVTVDRNTNSKKANVSLIVDGKLVLEDKLWLDDNSTVQLLTNNASFETTDRNALLQIGTVQLASGAGVLVPGPAMADVTTGTNPNGFMLYNIATLPVKFFSFNVSKAANGISVQWATAEGINAGVFQVERSEDGKTWRTVGSVKAVGNSTNVQNYSYTDRTALNTIAYYRIRQVDVDGRYTYTDVKTVTNQSNLANNSSTNVNIVASGGNVVVNFSKEVKGTVIVRLISFGGQVLAQQTYSQAAQQIIFNKTNVNKGNYIVSVSNNLDVTASKQVVL